MALYTIFNVFQQNPLLGVKYLMEEKEIVMLQMGGSFPPEWGDPDDIEMDCVDKSNAVTIQLKRIRS